MPRTIVISEPAQFRDGFSAWLGQVAHDRWSDFRVANWRAAIPRLKDKRADQNCGEISDRNARFPILTTRGKGGADQVCRIVGPAYWPGLVPVDQSFRFIWSSACEKQLMNTVVNAHRRGVATHARDAVYNEITSHKLVVDRYNSVS